MGGLTQFQRQVARTFFSLDAARSFVLSGGAALLAHDLVHRTTGDLDLFSLTASRIDDVAAAFTHAAEANGWAVTVVRQSHTFARLVVSGDDTDSLVIDLGIDSAPVLDTVRTELGPTFQPKELAARKILALFGRAEARDFCDVYELASMFDLAELCELATRIDPGFNRAGLIDALGSIVRISDDEFPSIGATAGELREFADCWRCRLEDE